MCDGRLFHSPGPAAENALSPKMLYVCVTTHVRLAVERSRRWSRGHPRSSILVSMESPYVTSF